MLDGLRNFAKTVPGKVLGAFLLVGVAGFGINNVILDVGNNTIARVGDQEISTRAFQRGYSNEINRFAMQFGRVPLGDEAVMLGLPTTVIQRLSQDAALDGLAAGFGLGVSEDRLSVMVRQDPSFGGTLGAFDASSFQQVLRNSGLTEAEYFSMQRRASGREQLILGLFGDVGMPETANRMLGRYLSDTRTIDYIVLSPTGFDVPEPTEEDLAAFLAENQTTFRSVERRVVDILSFSQQTLASSIAVPEDEVRAEYERTRASMLVPERRTIEQVVLAGEEQVALFERGLAEGRSFAELLAESGLVRTQLGTRARNELSDSALAEAAFALEEGAFTIIPGIGGRRAIHVASVTPEAETPFEVARDAIAQRLALAAARTRYAETLDQIEELRASFQPLSDIAERFGLALLTVPVAADGLELFALQDLPVESHQRVTQAIFAAQPARLNPAVVLSANHAVFFDLERIDPVRDLTLEEARDDLVKGWTNQAVSEATSAQADMVLERLEAGEALTDIGFSINQFAQLSSAFTRMGEIGTAIDQTVAGAAFAGGPGHHGATVNQSGEYVVFQVSDIGVHEGGLEAAERQALEIEMQNVLFGDFVIGLRDTAGLRINQQALEQFLAANTGL